MATSTITENKTVCHVSTKKPPYLTLKQIIWQSFKKCLIEYLRSRNLSSIFATFAILFGVIQVYSTISYWTRPVKINPEDLIKVKEYTITIEELAKSLDTNETLSITPDFNRTDLISQSFQIKFSDADQSISISSTMLPNENILENTKNIQFSTIRIKLNNNKTKPDSISFLAGVRNIKPVELEASLENKTQTDPLID